MNPAPNNNHHEPTEDDCELCGFMRPDFGKDEENTARISCELPGIAGGGGSSTYNPNLRQQEPRRYENQARLLNMGDLGPEWKKEEKKRLFPGTSNPGKFNC